MSKNTKIILGAVVGVPLFLGILGASIHSSSNNKSTASSQSVQTTITPIKIVKAAEIKITAIPTAKPTITPRPTERPIPTTYVAPTQYIAPIIPPASTQSSSGLSNDNYYQNVDGNEVHSPADSTNGSVPAGATAQCGDGTYSFSQNHSGTCSHHDGVAQWL